MADEPHPEPRTDEEEPQPMTPPQYQNDTDTMWRVLAALRNLPAA